MGRLTRRPEGETCARRARLAGPAPVPPSPVPGPFASPVADTTATCRGIAARPARPDAPRTECPPQAVPGLLQEPSLNFLAARRPQRHHSSRLAPLDHPGLMQLFENPPVGGQAVLL